MSSQGPAQVHKKPPVILPLFMAEAQSEFIHCACGTGGIGSDTLLAEQARVWGGGGWVEVPGLERKQFKSLVGVRRFTAAHGY